MMLETEGIWFIFWAGVFFFYSMQLTVYSNWFILHVMYYFYNLLYHYNTQVCFWFEIS